MTPQGQTSMEGEQDMNKQVMRFNLVTNTNNPKKNRNPFTNTIFFLFASGF